MCCTWLVENTGRKKSPKIGIWATWHKFVLLYLRNWCIHRQSEKSVKQQYLPYMSSQYGEVQPTNGWDRFTSLGHPIKFQRVSRLGFVTAPMSLSGGQPNFARCLAVSWAGTLYIHFGGFLPPCGILPAAKFTLRPRLPFSYIGSVTARCSSSGRQPNFVAWYKEWNYGTFAEGVPIFGWAAITLGIGPHSNYACITYLYQSVAWHKYTR